MPFGMKHYETKSTSFNTGCYEMDIMRRIGGRLLNRAKRRFMDDLGADPYLSCILLLAAVLSGFWFWHGIPEFATIDERWRLIDPLAAVGTLVADPELDAIRPAILAQKQTGATLYLNLLAVLPVVLAALVMGQLDVFIAFNPQLRTVDLWQFRTETPEWIWTWSLLLARFITVVLAVGCVYLTYRIGTAMRDRWTGRLAAVLLSFTWGFLIMAHEVSEDMPALFFLLLSIYLAFQYVRTGERTVFLAGCMAGGIAIAFKLTAGTSVIVLGVAYFLRARRVDVDWRDALVRPRLLVMGMAFGAAAVIVSFPEALVAGPDVLIGRASVGGSRSVGPAAPIAPSWWWLLRGYLNGFGIPLFVGVLGGVAAGIVRLRERSVEADATILLLAGLVAYPLVYSRWGYVRLHHLLLTFPLLTLLLAAALTRIRMHSQRIGMSLIAFLLVTSGVYAGVGDLHYATTPRDEAREWLHTHASDNATMEVYRTRFRDAVYPRDMTVNSYKKALARIGPNQRPPTRIEWMRNLPNRCPEFIQLTYWDLVYLGTSSPTRTESPGKGLAGSIRRSGLPPKSPAPRRTDFIRDLLMGEYNYTVAAEFGPRPPMWPQPRTQTSLLDLLYSGVYPWTITYGDDQDFRTEQYTMILNRIGRCGSSRNSSTQSSHASEPITGAASEPPRALFKRAVSN